MIRINLLPVKQINAEVSRRRDITLGALCLAATVGVIAVVYVVQFGRVSLLESELVGLRADLAVLNVKAKGVAELKSKINEVKSKHEVIIDIDKKKAGPVRVMESLSAATPGSLWLTQFKEVGGNLTITGVASDNQTIAEFLKALGNHAYFKNTELVETTQTDQSGLPPRRFLIRSRLLYRPVLAKADTDTTQTQVPVVNNNQAVKLP
ncbi:MAG: PilN domain-containing protein [Deltaproteobacteria bacterium]|nr:PilN domain-containing protein [Deltaproteobacteria bacterium]